MSSVRSFFGYRNMDKIEEDKKEVEKMKEKLDKEFMEKYQIEEEKLEKELEDFYNKKSIFDPDMIDQMPKDWVRFDLSLKIPEIMLSLGTKKDEQ